MILLDTSVLVALVLPKDPLHERATHDRYAEHEPDWVDGCLVVMANRDQRIWTYDGEFRAIWRRLDGTRVPLASPAR